jgi:hypothetical protein
MARVSETPRSSARGFPAGATEVWPDERSPDDWLGEVSDDDWSEGAAERARGRIRPRIGRIRASTTSRAPRHAARHRRRPEGQGGAASAVLSDRAHSAVAIAVQWSSTAEATGRLRPCRGPPPHRHGARIDGTRPSTTTTAPETAAQRDDATAAASESAPRPPTPTKPLGEGGRSSSSSAGLSNLGLRPQFSRRDLRPADEGRGVAFQQANGLSADGTVGPLTASALASAIATG